MVETPVLYITFARPEYARQSFAAIKKAQPKKLYFYSNKARADKPDEVARNEEVRSYIKEIDWDCELKTWFREDYVDVFTSLWGAIDWVFDNEERAIIIEEDVVASPAFFNYISKIIEKYENNDIIWMISGNNAAPQYNPADLSYFPTRFADIYGWASWRSRWKLLDKKLSFWPKFKESQEYHDYYDTWLQRVINKCYFNKVYNNIDTYNPWDFIFMCNMAFHKSYCLIPIGNLNEDIGISGVNHDQIIESTNAHLSYFSEEYEIMNEPSLIAPTSFDNKFFLYNRFGGLVRRKIKKYLGL